METSPSFFWFMGHGDVYFVIIIIICINDDYFSFIDVLRCCLSKFHKCQSLINKHQKEKEKKKDNETFLA